MWRTGFALVVLLWGCEDRKPPANSSEPPRAEESRRLPPADEVLADVEAVGGPAAPGEAIKGKLSPDGRFFLVWPALGGAPVIEIYDGQRSQLLHRIATDEAVAVRISASRARWTAGNHVLLTWGSGTNVANAVLYAADGSRLFDVAASATSISPSGRYLALFPTLLADEPVIEVYDLSTGSRVVRKAASEDTAWAVQVVEWQGRQLVARYRDSAGRVDVLRIELDAQP
jgi:hypothetical protein